MWFLSTQHFIALICLWLAMRCLTFYVFVGLLNFLSKVIISFSYFVGRFYLKAGLAFSSLFSVGCLWPLSMFIWALVFNWMLNRLSLWYYPSLCDEYFPASSFIAVLVFYCHITNYDKFSDLKQHKYTVSWLLWGLEPGCGMLASPLRVCHQAEI